MIPSLKKIALSLCTITCLAPLHAGIENLHGTYAILPPQWRHLSVAHGAILVETHWIDNFYDYYAAPSGKASALGQLVTTLYYHNPAGGFGLTKTLQTPKDSKHLAQQLAALVFAVATNQQPTKTKFRDVNDKGFDLKSNDILNAVKELAAPGPSAPCSFPHNTVLDILLAIVWSAGKDNRDFLNSYYEQIEKLIDEWQKPHPATEAPKKAKPGAASSGSTSSDTPSSSASGSETTQLQKPFKPLPPAFSTKPDEIALYEKTVIESFNVARNSIELKDLWEKQPETFEKLLYVLFLPGEYPTPISYTTVSFDTPERKHIEMTDCMDTALRNFMNVLWYKQESNTFTEDQLQKNAPEAAPLPILIDFYRNHSNPLTAGALATHREWDTLIGRVPGVVYDQDGFEVSSGLKNTIILLNHLLGLKLFNKDIQTLLFLRNSPTFINTYFPKVCQKLGIEFAWQQDNGQEISPDEIDKFENDRKAIVTLLKFKPQEPDFTHKLRTTTGYHGEFYYTQPKHINEALNKILVERQLEFRPLRALYGVTLWLHPQQTLTPEIFKEPTMDLLFYFPLYQDGFIDHLISQKILENTPDCFMPIVFNRIETIPDPSDRMETATQLLKNTKNLDSATITKIIAMAPKYIQSPEKAPNALDLLNALVNKGYALPEATRAIKETIQEKKDEKILTHTSTLLVTLVRKKLAYDSAITFISNIPQWSLRFYTLDSYPELYKNVTLLLEELIKAEQGYKEVATALLEIAQKTYLDYRAEPELIKLFTTILEKNFGYDDALTFIKIMIKKGYIPSYNSVGYIANLTPFLQQLLKKPDSFKQIMDIVNENLMTGKKQEYGYGMLENASGLLSNLYSLGLAYNEIISAVYDAHIVAQKELLKDSPYFQALQELKRFFDAHPNYRDEFVKAHPDMEPKMRAVFNLLVDPVPRPLVAPAPPPAQTEQPRRPRKLPRVIVPPKK